MDIITMARELGKEIQKDPRYLDMVAASEATEKDTELQKKMAEFSDLRAQLNVEVMKGADEKDEEKIASLDEQLRKLYTEVTEAPVMVAYNMAKKALESSLNFVSEIITASANGENPDTVEQSSGGCTGSCGSCGGCH